MSDAAPRDEAPAQTATPAATATEPIDFLTADIDDPIFKAEEPYKGLPHETSLVADLPDPVKKRVHNMRVGFTRKMDELKERERALAAREAAVTTPPDPAPAEPDPMLANARARRLLGLDTDGDDPMAGIADPMAGFDPKAILASMPDEVLEDPAKLREALADVLGKLPLADVGKYAREVAAEAVKTVMQPHIEQVQRAEQQSKEADYERRLAAWRAATPGMADDAAFDAVLERAEALGLAAKVDQSDIHTAYKVWAYDNVDKVRPAPAAAAPAPAVVAPPAVSTDPLEAFRQIALREQGSGSRMSSGAVPVMPKGLSSLQEIEWLNAHPEAREALRSGLDGARTVLGR